MELEELFESYLNGKMSEADATLFRKLLEENTAYQIQLDKYKERFKDNSELENPPKKSASKTFLFKSWSISGGIALAIVLIGYFLIKTLSMPPGEKLFLTYYEPIPIPDSLINSTNPMVAEAISSYKNKEYEQAESLFGALMGKDESGLSQLFLGLSQLELDRPEKAIPTLSLVSQKSEYFFEATWYGAMSFLKLNKLEEAKRLLMINDANPNIYSEKAEEILIKLK